MCDACYPEVGRNNVAKKQKTIFVCQECGAESPKYLGRCPSCGKWNTLVEERVQDRTDTRNRLNFSGKRSKAAPINEVEIEKEDRIQVPFAEFNRVLGGGVVPGSLVLIGGDPGIGKSTLLLQISAFLNNIGGLVLYVTGEESASQIKMRAERLDLVENNFYLYAETDLSAIEETVEEIRPNFLIIDSIQTMHHPDIDLSLIHI